MPALNPTVLEAIHPDHLAWMVYWLMRYGHSPQVNSQREDSLNALPGIDEAWPLAKQHKKVKGSSGRVADWRKGCAPLTADTDQCQRGQKAHMRGMKITDRMQKMRLSGMPARRKSVYLYPPGL